MDYNSKISKLMAYMITKYPLYGYFVNNFNPVPTKDVWIMAISCRNGNFRLYYNPQSLDKFLLKELVGVLQHQIKHIIFGHVGSLWRLANKNRTLANIAFDLAVNSTIKQTNSICLPNGCLYPQLYKLPNDKTSQWYYEKLNNEMQDIVNDIKQKMESGQLVVNDIFGSYDHLSPLQVAAIEQLLKDAQQKTKGIGNTTMDMSDFLKIRNRNKINWRRLLKNKLHKMSYVISDDIIYTKNKRSRRYGTIPGIKRDYVQNSILCLLDVSGSMSNETISTVLGQINNLFKHFKNIVVAQFDTQIKSIQNWRNKSQFERSGCGGTNITKQMVDDINQKYKDYKKIVLSDGYIYGDVKTINDSIIGSPLWIFTQYDSYQKWNGVAQSIYYKCE